MKLAPADIQRLASILMGIPALETERGRRQTLNACGLRAQARAINLTDPLEIAVTEIVIRLDEAGHVMADVTALGTFLNWIKPMVGLAEQAVLGELMGTYAMMVPVANQPRIPDWKAGLESEKVVLEKIIGENTLRPLAFLEEGARVGRSVAYIGLSCESGTGFLVAKNLLLTNHHVLPNVHAAACATFRFNFQLDWQGMPKVVEDYKAQPDGLFISDGARDFTIVELIGEPGATWGWLPLREIAVQQGDRVSVIQHPGGQHKQVSVQHNRVAYVDETILQYTTSTQPGSSGSPAFNDRREVVALHHAGGRLPEPATQHIYFRNEGVRISAILAQLPEDLRLRVAVCPP